MKFAYADPPYLGCGKRYASNHPDALDCDDPNWHRNLIVRLYNEFPDGWALSLSSTSLHTILPMCLPSVRIGAWVKPFAVFRPNVNPAYAWEPFLWEGGRRGDRTRPTVRDWVSSNITLKKGLVGAKPEAFCRHILDVLGFLPEDEVEDLFPGTGVFSSTVEKVRSERISI